MDCAIYTRVSADNQDEKEYNSCEAQEEKIKTYIRSQENLKLYKVYSEPGFSGASLERPGLKQMLHRKGADFVVDFLIPQRQQTVLWLENQGLNTPRHSFISSSKEITGKRSFTTKKTVRTI
jgi:hypothetical protein